MVYLANSSSQDIGGGWTFTRNLQKGLPGYVTEDYAQADVYFIPGATMVQRDEVAKAKEDGKKIVLRVDNAVRNSRNRNTGMSRMKDFAKAADLVIYQSRWAKDYLEPYLEVGGEVIHNGADEVVFYPGSHREPMTFVYSRYNRDETKNWEMARYFFSQTWQRDNNAHLALLGNYSPELVTGNFDFYMGERLVFLGVQEPMLVADALRASQYFLYSYFNDCCSNSLIEALLCGCEIVDVFGMLQTGGAPEIMAAFREFGPEYFHLDRMAAQYREAMSNV